MNTQLPVYYEYYNPVKINAGKEALETIPFELKLLNAERSLIITDKGIVAAGLLDVLINSFVDSELSVVAVFDETPSDSSVEVVNEIAEIFNSTKANSLIAIGGGSVIDTAKAVNILVSEKDDDLSKFMGAERLRSPQMPLIVVPTTAGTGSELTGVAVISDTDRKMKMPFTSKLLLPKLAILDPRMTMGLPPIITATTGMDALTHAVEAYTCLQKNPFSDAYALAAIHLIVNNLTTAVSQPDNLQARFAMANASAMAGTAFSNSMVGAVHAIGHACGAVAGVHHGNAMAVLMPHVMRYNADQSANLYAGLAPILNPGLQTAALSDNELAEQAADAIVRLNKELNRLSGMAYKFSDLGLNKDQFEAIADKALNDGAMIPNPKELDKKDVINILENAF